MVKDLCYGVSSVPLTSTFVHDGFAGSQDIDNREGSLFLRLEVVEPRDDVVARIGHLSQRVCQTHLANSDHATPTTVSGLDQIVCES